MASTTTPTMSILPSVDETRASALPTSTATTLYNVGKIKQLIELNRGLVNFNLEFTVKSLKGDPFNALVVSNEELDSGDEIKFQQVNEGIISGNIVNDNNIKRDYFLLLKSDTNVECEVTIDIHEIPCRENLPRLQDMRMRQDSPNGYGTPPTTLGSLSDTDVYIFGMYVSRTVLIVMAVGIILLGLYVWYNFGNRLMGVQGNRNSQDSETLPSNLITNTRDSRQTIPMQIPVLAAAEVIPSIVTDGMSRVASAVNNTLPPSGSTSAYTVPIVEVPSAGSKPSANLEGGIQNLKNKLDQFFGSEL
jgi:hypothetical protein